MMDDATGLLLPITVTGALLFIGTHLLASHFHSLVGSGRRPLHSFLAGFTTGYVFLKLLPGVAEERGGGVLPSALDGHEPLFFFGVSLLAFGAYYALEVRAWSQETGEDQAGAGAHGSAPPPGAGAGEGERRKGTLPPRPHPHVYRIHLGTFAALNAMAAFLLPHYATKGEGSVAIYIVAVAVHLLVMDRALAEMHGGRFGRTGRLVHSGAVVGGAGVALLVGPLPPQWMTGLVLSILAGALILQLVREEIPRNQEGRWGAFSLGALSFALLLLLTLVSTGGP